MLDDNKQGHRQFLSMYHSHSNILKMSIKCCLADQETEGWSESHSEIDDSHLLHIEIEIEIGEGRDTETHGETDELHLLACDPGIIDFPGKFNQTALDQ